MTKEDKAKAFDIIAKYFHLEITCENKNKNGEIIDAFLDIEEKEDYETGAWDVTATALISAEDLKIIRGVINVMYK